MRVCPAPPTGAAGRTMVPVSGLSAEALVRSLMVQAMVIGAA
jgi:hypothetical protein